MDLEKKLAGVIDPDRVLTRAIDRIAYANDASVYRLVPRAVVLPTSIEEVRALLRFSREHRVPVTFRAAGTSLSGQAVTDGILIVLSRHWRDLEIEDDGKRVRVQPGVIGGIVNQRLRPFGAKIGPDPASINACMMGGILANNSSGMCCGVVQNAYHTLHSMRYVLPDGLVVDSADPAADENLRRDAPRLVEGLLELKSRVEANVELRERIRAKYKMKNTTGYSLNALMDFTSPVDMLTHLLIGSEGTLAFIAEAVLDTVPDYPFKYTGLLFFPDVPRACAAIAPLRDSGARALELMDRASLTSIEKQPGVPPGISDLPAAAAAILTEYQCQTEDELQQRREACRRILPDLPLCSAAAFTTDPSRQDALWRVRKGLIPSVGAMRRRGTSFIIEDVVFPVDDLAPGVTELQGLFVRHGYEDAIVFGHAKDGNLHFVLTQAFDRQDDVVRYDTFMRDLALLVADRYGGALKAEHGTGRNMAPFVLSEWGPDAYEVMRSLKNLIDPDGLLNPGVILNDDPQAHVTHLKALPTVEAEVDQCIECGFCERMCPSRDLTMTPRQRIVVRREMARLRETDPSSPLLTELERDYRFDAVESCAADGLCAIACPVAIDTGQLIKRLRREAHSGVAQSIARMLAGRFVWVERASRLALRTGHAASTVVGDAALTGVTRRLVDLFGAGTPPWSSSMPLPASSRLPATPREGARAVYMPSCVTRVLGPDPGDREPTSVAEELIAVAGRAGVPVWIPDDVRGHCCGMPFASKGYGAASGAALNRTVQALGSWSEGGRLPIVIDSSPCSYTLKNGRTELSSENRRRFDKLQILDSIEFAEESVLPRLAIEPLDGAVSLHPVCSVHKMQLVDRFRALAKRCAASVDVPVTAGCCGFAGDRGFTLPQLTEAATLSEATEVRSKAYVGFFSSSRTCEIGLTRATGRRYRSFWTLLEHTSRQSATD